MPTVEARRGDFSSYGTTIYDPLTGNADGSGRTAFANNIIPPERISSRASDYRVAAASDHIGIEFELLCLRNRGIRSPLDRREGQLEPVGKFTVFGHQRPEVSGWTPVPFGRASGGAPT